MDYTQDEKALNAHLEQNADAVTPELLQVITSLIAQGQAVVEEAKGDQQKQQQGALVQLQKIYEAVLRFSMRQQMQAD